jgi:hypothetical protein
MFREKSLIEINSFGKTINMHVKTILACMLIMGVFHSSRVNSEEVGLLENNMHWSRLEFKTYLLFVSLKADVGFSKVKSSEIVKDFYNPPDKELLMPDGDEIFLLTMNSDNFGRKSDVSFLFEPDLTGLQINQVDSGRKNFIRTYRFGQKGVYRRDIFPKEQEEDLPNSKWTKLEHHEYPHPPEMKISQLTTNAALFYIVSAANLVNPGDSFTFHTFGKKHLNKIVLKVEDRPTIDVDYSERGNNGTRQVEDVIEVIRISITATPVGNHGGENEFEFLGLKEDIKIYVEPKNRIPVRVSSRVKVLGSVDIDLKNVQLMTQPK